MAAAHRAPGALIVAFAAEPEPDAVRLEAAAREKLRRKGADAIVANDVSAEDAGFDVDRNGGLFLTPEATVPLPQGTKRAMAERILDGVLGLRAGQAARGARAGLPAEVALP